MNRPSFFQRMINWLRRLFSAPPPAAPAPAPAPEPLPEPVTRKVGLLIYNPTIPSQGGRKLTEVMGWNDPDRLVAEFIEEVRLISHGYANYTITERIEVDDFPLKEDNYRYTPDHYLRVIRSGQGVHQPDLVNYRRIVEQHQLVQKINAGQIDEVWAILFPWGGFFESRMAGPDAFWCNAPPLVTPEPASRRFIIMGFSYERGIGEMLESFGHRAESILEWVHRGLDESENLWHRFIRHEKTHPGLAEVGNVHFAPNSQRDYEWGSSTPVLSRCRNWTRYPDLSGQPATVTCDEWGGGDIRAHHRWWFRLMPHIAGENRYHGGRIIISNNWWEYIVDPNRAP